MMIRWVLVMVMTSTLWTICLSQNECTSTIINTTEIVFTCLPNVIINELPLYNYTTSVLAKIISIVVNGINDTTPGPFTSIPPNICLLPSLQSIDFSYNHISQVDPAAVVSRCLSNVITLDVSYNTISEFPSAMIYNMPSLQNLYFQHNQLTDVPSNAFFDVSNLEIIDFSYNSLTSFELWTFLVIKSADFRNNRISTITNKNFFNMPLVTVPLSNTIYLSNNSPTINLTDAIYEMYNACDEVIEKLGLPGNTGASPYPIIAYGVVDIDFGTTQINCSCDQAYILEVLLNTVGQLSSLNTSKIYNTTCTGGTKFLYSSCAPNNTLGTTQPNSSVDFTQVYPRQCKILQGELGNLTTVGNISVPSLNASTYPHYETRLMNPGACFFTFSNTSAVRIRCTSDISASSTIPSSLLSTTYFSNVAVIDLTPPISSLPPYLCSLPSHEIDLSYQAFTTLTNQTFPCLDWFHKVTLAHNNLASVNMPSGNFTTLSYLDLSSNRLTTLPYSILTPTPSSLRYLDLRNNLITSIDLFLYTLKNITVDLRGNPINSSSIINPQNITLPSGNNTNSTAIITFPSSVTNSTYIFNDQTALTAGTCNRDAVLAYQNTLQMTYSSVVLDCICASINLKEIFSRSGSSITNSFNCSSGTSAANFATLTMSSCASTALNFTTGLCYNASLQTFTNDTTMGTLSTPVQITSTSLTTAINSSISTNVTQTQQYTSLPGFEETGLGLYTLPFTSSSYQLSTIDTETTTTTTTTTASNSSYIDITSASSGNNSNSMFTESGTSSLSSTMSMISSTTMATSDTDMKMSTSWTTTTTSTTTSSTTTSTSTSTTTTSQTTSTSSTSASTSTSTSTTTTSVTTTSTTTSTTSTSATTSTSSTSSSTSTSTSTTTTSETTTSTTTSSTTTSVTTTTASNASDTNLQSSGTSDSSTSRTGLIVGLVVGLVGFFALVGGLIAAIVIAKSKSARANKPVGRATAISRAPQDALLESRVQTRNLRGVRLAPLAAQASKLPPLSGSVAPVTITSSSPAKGIPIRFDPIRSPSNVVPQYAPSGNTPNDSSAFHSSNNPSINQRSLPQQQLREPRPRRPRLNQLLNAGGDTRY